MPKMAAPLAIMLKSIVSKNGLFLPVCTVPIISTRSAFFWRKNREDSEHNEEGEVRKVKAQDGPTTTDRLQSLKKKTSVRTKKAYTPPNDLENRLENAVKELCGEVEWRRYQLADRRIKFKLLTRLMKDLDHDIPNLELHNMNTVDDVLVYFSTPVRDTSSYEDLSKLNLPKNMHIQLEPLRFDPETDTMFGGKTAFPGSKTIVTSLRYKNKFGNPNK